MNEAGPPRRKPNRLAGFDYRAPRPYFVTIVTHHREPLLGDGSAHGVRLNEAGRAVDAVWLELPARVPLVAVDLAVVMPNHTHALVTLQIDPDDPLGDRSRTHGLSEVMRAFKSLSAIAVNRVLNRAGLPVWQRSFHDRIVRNESEYARIWEYIETNPARWLEDREYQRGR